MSITKPNKGRQPVTPPVPLTEAQRAERDMLLRRGPDSRSAKEILKPAGSSNRSLVWPVIIGAIILLGTLAFIFRHKLSFLGL